MKVNPEFVRLHARFGKSKPRPDRGGKGELVWGSRKSDKYVRTYSKREINAYRVEVELRSPILRGAGIRSVWDLPRVAAVVAPAHINFVEWDQARLRKHLAKRGARGRVGLKRIRSAKSLHGAMAVAREEGIVNVHRFLRPLPINREIERALKHWASGW